MINLSLDLLYLLGHLPWTEHQKTFSWIRIQLYILKRNAHDRFLQVFLISLSFLRLITLLGHFKRTRNVMSLLLRYFLSHGPIIFRVINESVVHFGISVGLGSGSELNLWRFLWDSILQWTMAEGQRVPPIIELWVFWWIGMHGGVLLFRDIFYLLYVYVLWQMKTIQPRYLFFRLYSTLSFT